MLKKLSLIVIFALVVSVSFSPVLMAAPEDLEVEETKEVKVTEMTEAGESLETAGNDLDTAFNSVILGSSLIGLGAFVAAEGIEDDSTELSSVGIGLGIGGALINFYGVTRGSDASSEIEAAGASIIEAVSASEEDVEEENE